MTSIDPVDYWKAHKSYALCEIIFLIGAVAILIHCECHCCVCVVLVKIHNPYVTALKQGGRWPWLFLATILHGFTVENMAYFAPFIENFWHAQGVVTFLDRRMAIYIVFLCEFYGG